jgi:hypothetical protein
MYEKNPLYTAAMINRIIKDSKLKDYIIEGQRKRRHELSYDKTAELFKKNIALFLKGEHKL